ncbi:MAG TPA: hypothetical protein VL362_02845 [Patescibacteria group bacterium]|jgi:hypothetical protein|nr:hypothetical protein [Patescibacteria group bacterium]
MSTSIDRPSTIQTQTSHESRAEQLSFVQEIGIAASNAAMWLLETATRLTPTWEVRGAPYHDDDLDRPDMGV